MSRKVSNMSTLHYGGIFGDLEDLERALQEERMSRAHPTLIGRSVQLIRMLL